MLVASYQHGMYPRSEAVVEATRGLDRGRTSPAEVDDAYRRDEDAFLRAQREAGLDLHSDGLLRWQDVFRPLVDACEGLRATALVRWFDNNAFFRTPEIVGGPLALSAVPDLVTGGRGVPEPRVATLPSPFMFSRAAAGGGDRDRLMVTLARELLGPAAAEVTRDGCRVVHLQEPWLVFFGIEDSAWDALERALLLVRESMAPGTTLVLHTYFGDAAPHVRRLRRLPVDALGIDFVETDPAELGTAWEVGLLAGCLDGRSSPVESVEGTADFVVRVTETLQPPVLFLSSTCDLERLPSVVAERKVRRLGEVSARVKEALS